MSQPPALHPFNEAFEWRSSPVGGRLSAAQRADFDEKGFMLHRSAFDPEQIARAIEEIDPWERKVEDFLRTRADGRLFIARAGAR